MELIAETALQSGHQRSEDIAIVCEGEEMRRTLNTRAQPHSVKTGYSLHMPHLL